MRMRIYRKTQRYDLAVQDGMTAHALMTQKQLIKYQGLRQAIKEMQILHEHYENKRNNIFLRVLKVLIQFMRHNKKVLLLIIGALVLIYYRHQIKGALETFTMLKDYVKKV